MSEQDGQTPPKLDYFTPGGQQRKRHVLLWLFGVFLFLSFAVSVFLPSIGRPRAVADRVKSASNMRQIGQAIILYCNDHSGQFPDSFATILMNEDIGSGVFVSPHSNDTPAAGPTTQSEATQLSMPGHLSYLYLGQGLTQGAAQEGVVIAYENLAIWGDGANVLFGDGHVEWLDAAAVKKIIAKAGTGSFPVTRPEE